MNYILKHFIGLMKNNNMAKKYAVISTDNNPDYYSLVPLTCLGWSKLGYIPVVILTEDLSSGLFSKYCPPETIYIIVAYIEGVRNSTLVQVARLYITSMIAFEDDDIIITGDSDMIVMKDIFTQDAPFVSYGYDLTGRSETPICYLKGTSSKWKEIFGTEMIMPPNAYSDDWNLYWGVDQQIATSILKQYGFQWITFVDRGNDQNNKGMATARWDRYCWDFVPADIIDVHIIRSPLHNWSKIIDMAYTLWPDDNFDWLEEFYNEVKY